MSTKRIVLGLASFILVSVVGLSQGAADDVIAWLDPPPAGMARVEEVFDGDTILVRFGESQERVRFIGVDTPETNHPNKAVQCFGKAATEYLRGLIDGEDVRLEADPTNTNRDRYDRLLRYVYFEGELLNQKIIEEGYGFAYVAFPFEKKADFEAAQISARETDRGLWSQCEVEQDDTYFNTAPAAVDG